MTQTKRCSKCKIEKLLTDTIFMRRSENPARRWKSWCRDCLRRDALRYQKTDRGRALANATARRRHHRNKLAANMRTYINLCLRSSAEKKDRRKWEIVVGYDEDALSKHLERQFTKKMSWANYGTYWQIDHILPVSSFDIANTGLAGLKACWALSNLRPLERSENHRKKDKRIHLI